ncbi:MBL fold metallo-hydrolase [Agromyces rhizosphaerae]|uniref:MBL fold metallo-hydrolase n=2 Tax=Agromyces rhizosphaerae TaxID=88374 RepID=A0A9W6FR16_9MICO|nr:MBL fold metallo-hydrolase [Agromyces rhizosphaerae]
MRGALPDVEEFAGGWWSIPVPMPGGHIPYNLCYAVRDDAGGVHLIDPGWPTTGHLDVLAAGLAHMGAGLSDVRTVTATHLHTDHLGGAGDLRAATSARIVLHREEDRAVREMAGRRPAHAASDAIDRWGVPADRRAELEAHAEERVERPTADVLVDDGDLLPIPGRSVRVVHTPGHTTGHICLRDEDAGVLFTGDLLLPTIHPGVGLGAHGDANPLADYLSSLQRIARFDNEAAPGHEYRFRGVFARTITTAEHHLRRTREVQRVLQRDRAHTVWEVASELTWSAGWANLQGFFLMSALAQTAMHIEFVQTDAGRTAGG